MIQKSSRRLVREKVLQILYAYEYNNEGLQILINSLLNEFDSLDDRTFGEDLVNRVQIHKNEFDKEIEKRVSNWEMGRIAIIDKHLLRMGMCEILYFSDIPPKVSINEVIEISKEYSTAGSGKFINGILDSLLIELKQSGKLKKFGRGLINEKKSNKTDD